MEHYDSQMAARVWQRVQSRDSDTTAAPDILAFLQAESADLSRYRQLSALHGLASKPERNPVPFDRRTAGSYGFSIAQRIAGFYSAPLLRQYPSADFSLRSMDSAPGIRPRFSPFITAKP